MTRNEIEGNKLVNTNEDLDQTHYMPTQIFSKLPSKQKIMFYLISIEFMLSVFQQVFYL